MTISGTIQVWETLTAELSGVEDLDGLDGVCFRHPFLADDTSTERCGLDQSVAKYSWYAVDSGSAAGSGYLLGTISGDPSFIVPSWAEGMAIRVSVRFYDDDGQNEELRSAAGGEVAAHSSPAVPGPPVNLWLTPGDSGELDMAWSQPTYGDGGSVVTRWKVQWKEATGSWDTPADVAEHEFAVSRWLRPGWHTITGLDDGRAVSARVIAVNSVGDGEPSAELTATPGGGLSLSGVSSRQFEENSRGSMGAISLADPNGAVSRRELADEYRVHGAGNAAIEWSLSGADADDFSISGTVCVGYCRVSATRPLTSRIRTNYAFLNFAAVPDYESPTDTGEDNVYEVTIHASDGIKTVTMDVTVEVTDADEPSGGDAQDIGGL